MKTPKPRLMSEPREPPQHPLEKQIGGLYLQIEARDNEIERLRAALIDVGDFADKALEGETIFHGIALCDAIFRCAAAISPETVDEPIAD